MPSKKSMIFVSLMLVTSMVLSTAGVMVGGTPPVNDGIDAIYMTGDWVVSVPDSYADETIVLTGNLSITGAGTLELINVTLVLNSTNYDGEYGITVWDGGHLYVNDTDGDFFTPDDMSSITNNATADFGYFFQVNDTAVFEMRNSKLDNCGLFGVQPDAAESGPRILSDSRRK